MNNVDESLVENVLLVIYHHNAFYRQTTWGFESAFRTLNVSPDAQVVDTVANEFVKRGWANFDHGDHDGDVGRGCSLTERGTQSAIKILEKRHFTGLVDQLHRLNWLTWGGLAAVTSAIFAAIAAIPVLKGLVQ